MGHLKNSRLGGDGAIKGGRRWKIYGWGVGAYYFHVDMFENGFLYLKVLIGYFQKMYRFNTIGHTVDEINAYLKSQKMQKMC